MEDPSHPLLRALRHAGLTIGRVVSDGVDPRDQQGQQCEHVSSVITLLELRLTPSRHSDTG
jgi:hypothetical protein